MNYTLLWIVYFLAAGLATYYVFNANIIYIVVGIISFELTYYLIYRKRWFFVQRYILNMFYIIGVVTPFIFA